MLSDYSQHCKYRRLSRFASEAAVPAAQADVGISGQEKAQKGSIVLAKSCDCCAVVGQVCWFCFKSGPHLSRGLHEKAYG